MATQKPGQCRGRKRTNREFCIPWDEIQRRCEEYIERHDLDTLARTAADSLHKLSPFLMELFENENGKGR